MARINNTKKLAVLSMLTALSVAILYLGSFIEVLDLSVAVIASILTVVAVIEYGGGAPWLIYAATSVLSLVLLPQKMPAFVYAIFFGFYPIIKEKLEKYLKPWLSWLIKIVIFNVAIFATVAASKWLFIVEANTKGFDIAFIALAEVTLILYDVALTRVITLYVFKLRKRFKFLK